MGAKVYRLPQELLAKTNGSLGWTNTLYNARLSVVKEACSLRRLARLHGARAPHAARWMQVKPTEAAYQSDECYRYAVHQELGLPPSAERMLPRRCGVCGTGVAADGVHGQRHVHNGAFTKLRHDSIAVLPHSTIRDGVGLCRQQRQLPAAGRLSPDLVISLNNVPIPVQCHCCLLRHQPGRGSEKARTTGQAGGEEEGGAVRRRRSRDRGHPPAVGRADAPLRDSSRGGCEQHVAQR